MVKWVFGIGAGMMALSACMSATDAPIVANEIANEAKPSILDCPLRDAPFSLSSPLYDVLINQQAKAVLESHLPKGALAQMPAIFSSTEVPSFAVIVDINAAAGLMRLDAAKVDELGAALGAVPVTDVDRMNRCARYDDQTPVFTIAKDRPNLLVFEKIVGYRDGPSVDAARTLVIAMAERRGWNVQFTEMGGAFKPEILKQFDAVLWNNISGDVLTLNQRAAFQDYLANGGGYVGFHGSAGDPTYFWDWYPDTLIGARFAGHPNDPRYQETRVIVNGEHPLSAGLPTEWRMTDEWYAFKTNPKASGATVLLSLDESLYSHKGFNGEDLSMGGDHPIAWTKCIGKGRMFYSAIGHMPDTYSHPINMRVMENGLEWALLAKSSCPE